MVNGTIQLTSTATRPVHDRAADVKKHHVNLLKLSVIDNVINTLKNDLKYLIQLHCLTNGDHDINSLVEHFKESRTKDEKENISRLRHREYGHRKRYSAHTQKF